LFTVADCHQLFLYVFNYLRQAHSPLLILTSAKSFASTFLIHHRTIPRPGNGNFPAVILSFTSTDQNPTTSATMFPAFMM
jgi:hypothetical protein